MLPTASGLIAITRGEGPDVVLVHGALGDYRQWSAIGASLETRFHVTAVSRRHHWPNPMPPADARYTYEAQSHDLTLFLRSIGRPVHLVGHSWGAGVALLSALADFSTVRSLVLIEPSFGSLLLPEDASALKPELASRDALMAAMQRLARAGDDEAASRTLMDWLRDSERGFDTLPKDARDALLDNAKTIGPTFAVAAPKVTCDQLRGLEVPSLLLHGARTRLFYRRIAERAASCLRGAELQSIPACGHMSIIENPAAVTALLLPFLDRH